MNTGSGLLIQLDCGRAQRGGAIEIRKSTLVTFSLRLHRFVSNSFVARDSVIGSHRFRRVPFADLLHLDFIRLNTISLL